MPTFLRVRWDWLGLAGAGWVRWRVRWEHCGTGGTRGVPACVRGVPGAGGLPGVQGAQGMQARHWMACGAGVCGVLASLESPPGDL
jgi:hypothetical protein